MINYVDKEYPCDCECHTNKNVLHCVPCCYDGSYKGAGKCIAHFDDSDFYLFKLKNGRNLKLHLYSVVFYHPELMECPNCEAVLNINNPYRYMETKCPECDQLCEVEEDWDFNIRSYLVRKEC